MSAATESSEMIEIKALLKMLVESQAKQAESQARLAETQADTQQHIIEILESTISAGHKQQGVVANYVPGKHDILYEAISENDWGKATEYLKHNPEAINEGITYDSSTALQLAIDLGIGTPIIEEIVKLMKPKMLECKNTENGNTALHLAAWRGNTKVAVMLVNTNSKLPQIRSYSGKTPLESSLGRFTVGQKEIVEYLYSVTRDEEPSPFVGNEGATLLCRAIFANFYNLALCLVNRFPELVMVESSAYGMCGLELLVRRPFAFRSGAKMTWWQDRIYSVIQVDINTSYGQPITCQSSLESKRDEDNRLEVKDTEIDEENPLEFVERDKENRPKITKAEESLQFGLIFISLPFIKKLYKKKLMHVQATALLKQILLEIDIANDSLEIRSFFNNNSNIIKVAIKHGLVEFVVGLLWHFSYLNSDNNTILHYAAKQAPPAQLNMISGVALQMQRELQWFQGVEGMMSECDRWQRNKNGDTAQFIFQVEHKDLLKKGEDWMKDTSGSCMIVAALIATVAFAAAFTVPGGNISDTNSTKNGTPVFLGQPSFTVFVVADALALFASITSALMFLAIYTSRYAEIDFLSSLPQKLIIGLSALFISMAAILVAFGASLYIVVGDRFAQATIPIALFSCCPMVLFAWLQLPLFYEMVRSTYWVSVLRKHRYIST
ncbi:hypothetical protein C5167_035572 [Papaver somniferum]|uniref:PGG domain-containing protein n=1 Tax=Papaver somniferum TaxID=3469 RepID=A0A4Y7KKG3_PAPSO|nr:hypothetical protein C5167_035572 [Papaver somniferum]